MALLRALSDRIRKMAAGTADAEIARQKAEALCRQARQIVTTAKTSSDSAKELRRLLGAWTA
jgi:F0F1-type ATP synthase membrane subunit b/b'